MWFRKKAKELSPYLYTFERVGTNRDPMRGPRTVQASGDATVDELLSGLCMCTPRGNGWSGECQELVLRIRAVDKPKAWQGDK